MVVDVVAPVGSGRDGRLGVGMASMTANAVLADAPPVEVSEGLDVDVLNADESSPKFLAVTSIQAGPMEVVAEAAPAGTTCSSSWRPT